MLTQIIREDLLYYLWKTKSFNMKNLKTQDGQPIEIFQFGNQNHDSGPDFSNGIIKIGGTLWAGNIEMHVFSSDWERHSHDIDRAYDNVILHVVYEHDKEVYTTSEQFVPCLELKNRIPKNILKNYSLLISNEAKIPCEKHIGNVENHITSFWMQRMVAERMEEKTSFIKSLLIQTNNDWQASFHVLFFRYMGARVNMEPFESLARNVPLSIIRKNIDDFFLLEALLFGQAGMLKANFKDDYFQALKLEYLFLSKKYNLKPIQVISWKFSRMRPAGFPTIRIAQLARIIFENTVTLNHILEANNIDEIKARLKICPSSYWNTHYRFDKLAPYREKFLGDDFMSQLIINVICPTLFHYGKYFSEEKYSLKAIAFLEALKPESNKITRAFSSIGVNSKSAADSQALIHLKKNYCDQKKCMSCSIGNSIIT